MVYTLGYFIRWQRIARFAILVPITACIVAIFTASESPVYLISQNKVIFGIISPFKLLYGKTLSIDEAFIYLNQNILYPVDRTGENGADSPLWPKVQSPRGS